MEILVGARSLQRTAVQFADFPVPGAGGGLHGFLSGSMQRTVAQNDDFPAHSDDFRSFLPAQGSHESRGAHHHADQGLLSGEHHDYGRLHGAEEEEADDAHVPDSVEWVQLSDPTSKPLYWNRRTRATVWKPPPGVKVVWVGTEDSECKYHT